MGRAIIAGCLLLAAASPSNAEGLAGVDVAGAITKNGSGSRSKLYPVTVEGKHGFIDATGKIVFTLPSDVYIVFPFYEGLAAFGTRVPGTHGRWGYVSESGKVAIPPRFQRAQPFSEDLAAVLTARDDNFMGGMGFIDKNGRIVIEPQFVAPSGHFKDDAGPEGYFSEGLSAVRSKDFIGYIDHSGAFVIPPRFVEAFPFSEGLAAVAPSKIVSPSFGYVDRTGKLAIAVQFDTAGSFSEGLAAVVVGDPPKVGYIDGRGKMVIAPQFEPYSHSCGEGFDFVDQSREFSESLAAVRVDRRFGYIDRTGRMVIAATYDCAAPFSGGLALIGFRKPDGGAKLGFIDRNGKTVIEPRFAAARSFDGPLAWVGTGLTEGQMVVRALTAESKGASKAQLEKLGEDLEKQGVRGAYIDRTGRVVWKE